MIFSYQIEGGMDIGHAETTEFLFFIIFSYHFHFLIDGRWIPPFSIYLDFAKLTNIFIKLVTHGSKYSLPFLVERWYLLPARNSSLSTWLWTIRYNRIWHVYLIDNVSGVKQSDSATCIYKYKNMCVCVCVCVYIYIYISDFFLLSYDKILNIVPCGI